VSRMKKITKYYRYPVDMWIREEAITFLLSLDECMSRREKFLLAVADGRTHWASGLRSLGLMSLKRNGRGSSWTYYYVLTKEGKKLVKTLKEDGWYLEEVEE
jgi:hypothetical protein